MNFPDPLQKAIEELLKPFSRAELVKASQDLSKRYREQTDGIKPSRSFFQQKVHTYAYLALRFPATFAAIYEALKHLPRSPKSVLDIGSGPGTMLWAALAHFPGIESATLVEADREMVKIARVLLNVGTPIRASWAEKRMQAFETNETFDLAAAAYALSELSESDFEPMLQKMWNATKDTLFIIEPGTPYGYRQIMNARTWLIAQGAHIVAPCTHKNACPFAHTSDWCHFATRLDRNEWQRFVKSASLGYEDEKYSYLIVSRLPVHPPYARIVKTPLKKSGHVRLTLCTAEGLVEKVVAASAGESYKEAKKLSWGDSY